MRWLLSVLFVLTLIARADPAPPPANTNPKPGASERKLESLATIVKPLENSGERLENLRSQLKKAATDEAKLDIQARIDAEQAQIRNLRQNFRDTVGGAEAADYSGATAGETGIQEQVSELIQPMLGQLRQATSAPRELDALRKSLAFWREREQNAQSILKRIDRLTALNKNPLIARELESARELWVARKAESTSQIDVINDRISEREAHKRPVIEALSDAIRRFFRNSGLNLLLALAAGTFAFFATRRAYVWLRRISPIHRRGRASLLSRSSDILAMATAVLTCIISILLVLYVSGDWFLLTLAIILIAGAAWAGKNALPPYLEQIRMMLNLGSVREGERLIYQDLPWKVRSIGLFTELSNPNLQGGALRIPVQELMGRVSREPDPKEPWFPTQTDDWVILSDSTYGKIITQTPEQVVVLRLGGSLKTFATTAFLELTPENLSRGFRVNCTFGIDYRHQAESATTIPETLRHILTSALVHDFGREAVRSIKVEIVTAAASSIDFAILADFDGSVASRYNALHRRIQRFCVEACTDHGWAIPFTQITVHQAGGADEPEEPTRE